MIWSFLLDIILIPVRLIFGLIGLLPNVAVTVGEYAVKAIGWGCYMCGTPVISALFVSIAGWCTVFAVIAIFKFIKQYIPVA